MHCVANPALDQCWVFYSREKAYLTQNKQCGEKVSSWHFFSRWQFAQSPDDYVSQLGLKRFYKERNQFSILFNKISKHPWNINIVNLTIKQQSEYNHIALMITACTNQLRNCYVINIRNKRIPSKWYHWKTWQFFLVCSWWCNLNRLKKSFVPYNGSFSKFSRSKCSVRISFALAARKSSKTHFL